MKQDVDAIFSEDLKNFLEKTGEIEKIEKGQIFCQICDNLLDLNNIQLIIPNKKLGFKYICDRPDCVEKYYDRK